MQVFHYLNKPAIHRVWFFLSLLLHIGFLLILFADIGDTQYAKLYINSDMIYMPVIFQDLFTDKTGLAGWHMNAAPNFLPDMLIYFFYMGTAQNFLAANMLFSITQVLLILGLSFWLFHQVNPGKSYLYCSLFNLLMFLFLLIPVFTNRFFLAFQLVSISYHMGSYLLFLLSLNLLVLYFRRKSSALLAALCLVSAMGAFNDRLYISQFTLPLALLTPLFFFSSHRKNLLRPIIMILSGSLSAYLLFTLLSDSKGIHFADTGFKMFNFQNIGSAWDMFTRSMVSLFLKLNIERWIFIITLLSFLLGIVFIYFSSSRKFFLNPPPDAYLYYLILILLFYIPVTLMMPVINGSYIAHSLIRLNIMAFILGVMFLPLCIAAWPQLETSLSKLLNYFVPAGTLAFMSILIVFLSNSDIKNGLRNYLAFYPDEVAVLDGLKTRHDLKYGIADYWDAKYMTMLSREGLRIYSVYNESLNPYRHSTNENWFYPGGKGRHADPVFNFIVYNRLNPVEQIHEIFGDRIDTLAAPGQDLLFLKTPDFVFDRSSRKIVVQ